jgi:hypothetical protein
MSFDAKVKILCPPTAALSDLRKGLNAADLPLRKNIRVKPGMEPKKKDIAGGTKLQSAVRQCSDGFMLNASGRKALLLLTDGIGFVPDGGQAGEYRKLSLQTKRPGLAVQARAGYYAR